MAGLVLPKSSFERIKKELSTVGISLGDDFSVQLNTEIIETEGLEQVVKSLVAAYYNLEKKRIELKRLTKEFSSFVDFASASCDILKEDLGNLDVDVIDKLVLSKIYDICNFEAASVFVKDEKITPVCSLGQNIFNETGFFEPALESFIANGLNLSVNTCEVDKNNPFYKFCNTGIQEIFIATGGKVEKGLALVVAFSKPLSQAKKSLLKLAFDFIYLAHEIAEYECQIKAYTQHLESLVSEKVRELEDAKKKAEEANESKNRFIANMSHDLRTPLTAILGYAQILVDGLLGPLSKDQLEAIQHVFKACEHLKSLIDELLNLARLESGKEIPRPEDLTWSAVVETVNILRGAASQKKLQLIVEEPVESLKNRFFKCDKRHLRQILLNLVSNAIKYTPEGGTVIVSAEKKADKIKISVKDTGVGISDDLKGKLFQRFERGSDQYSSKQEGTGIGLAITRYLVNLNGGILDFESKEGQGSVFWFLLPLGNDAQNEIVQKEDSKMSADLTAINVLIAEDDDISASFLTKALNKRGAKVTVVCDDLAAFEVLEKENFDVFILDLGLKGLKDGRDLLRSLRLEKKIRLPVVILSANDDPKVIKECFELGADEYIKKPFMLSDFMQCLVTVLRKSFLGGKV